MVPLEHQCRERWDRVKIEEGILLVKSSLAKQRVGPYQIQAAISAIHAESLSWLETDWPQIYALYSLLHQLTPSPVIKINQAIACSYAHSPEKALICIESILETDEVERYQPYFLAKSDILYRCGRLQEAISLLKKGIELCANQSNRLFLERKLAQLKSAL